MDSNEIGDVGAVGFGEGLKTNTVLQTALYVDVWRCLRDCKTGHC
jgi:hypothetical protein